MKVLLLPSPYRSFSASLRMLYPMLQLEKSADPVIGALGSRRNVDIRSVLSFYGFFFFGRVT